jgi:UDP-N-acetylmuramoylalanine--D-glutamate ligase
VFVLAPGVPLTHPKPHWTVNLADEAGVPVIGDIELFVRERGVRAPDAPFVAITGTNGKSTTTALIAHVLKEAGHEVAMGGNIGVPVLDLPPPAAGRTHVVECSSYQIDLAPSLAPSVGLLINITPDHLDRHGDLARYAAIKERLVAQAEIALVGVDDQHCRDIYARLKARSGAPRTLAVSGVESPHADVWVSEHRVMAKGEAAPAADLAGARALGVERDRIARAFETFPGLAHRMEEVGRFGRVLFINDSKATNADAAEKALMSFHDIHWILGGRPKAGGVEPLRPLFPRVAKAYLIGEASDEFARTLTGVVPFDRYGTLDAAIEAAAEDAAQSRAHEPVVLLSPACASFDQFANFEARGDAFRAHVVKWLERRAPAGTQTQTGR